MLETLLISSLLFHGGESFASVAAKSPRSVIAQKSYPGVAKNGITFKLQACRIAEHSDSLMCDFLVENTRSDTVELFVYRRNSRMIDAEGNEIPAALVQVGSRNSYIGADAVLPVGVPVKGSVLFKGSLKGGFRLIELGCYVNQGGPFSVEFRPSSSAGDAQ